ncbi:MAG: oligosaccharide flippase family protein, partial [Oscillospiraceae bacterium]|nr:oligosaccharide flippase family protein [Oscillospiraceae bacterium]
MTEGAPLNKIILFAFPMLIGNIAQQLYSTVDSIVVGKYVGDNALAAVGSSAPVYNLLLVLFIGVSTGSSIMVSQYFGAKDKESLAKSIGNSLSLTAVVSLVIMALSLVVVDPMLHML